MNIQVSGSIALCIPNLVARRIFSLKLVCSYYQKQCLNRDWSPLLHIEWYFKKKM